MEVWYAIVQFFENGGAFMYPILLALGLGVSVERYVTLTLARKRNRQTWEKLEDLIRKGEFEKARELSNKDNSAIAQLFASALARQGAVLRREDIDRAMEET